MGRRITSSLMQVKAFLGMACYEKGMVIWSWDMTYKNDETICLNMMKWKMVSTDEEL